MVINEIHCKSILNKSGIPSIDYGINPYVGCGHKCQYCYAVFMKRFSGHVEPWGDFVDVKINAPEVIKRQLKRLKRRSHISFGTVCDAYQPLEAQYEITRKCLQELAAYKHEVSILTKSNLVLRDVDILKKLKDIEVGFTITSLDPKVKKIFEPLAPPAKKRFEALKTLSQHNIPTWVFVAPTLPYISDSEEALGQLLQEAQSAGAEYILFDTLNPYPKVWNNVIRLIKKYFPEALDFYDFYYHNKTKYERNLERKISKIAQSHRITYRTVF